MGYRMIYMINGRQVSGWKFKRMLRRDGAGKVDWIIGYLVISGLPIKLGDNNYWVR